MSNTTVETKPLTDAERAAAADKARADAKTRSDAAASANADAAKLRTTAVEDRAKVDAETDPAKKPDLEKTARESAQKADDGAAKAAEADRAVRGGNEPSNIADAKVLGYGKDEGMPAGHHLAQKFGNDPANPKPANGLNEAPELATVRLSRQSGDHPGLIFTSCHPDMVGDYLRAGWNRDDVQAGAYALSKEDQEAADKRAEAARPTPAPAYARPVLNPPAHEPPAPAVG